MAQATVFDQSEIPPQYSLSDENNRRMLLSAPVIAYDIETEVDDPDGLDKRYGLSYVTQATHIGLTWTEQEGVGVVLRAPFSPEDILFLQEVWARKDVILVAHNAVFDHRIMGGQHQFPLPDNPWCTQVVELSMGLRPREQTGLLALVKIYRIPADLKRLQAAKSMRSNLNAMPPEELVWYVLEDSRLALGVYYRQQAIIQHLTSKGYPQLYNVIHDMELPYLRECLDMAAKGIAVDLDYVTEFGFKVQQRMMQILSDLIDDGLTNVQSYSQRCHYFFEVCGVERPDPDDLSLEHLFTPQGRYAFTSEAMEYYEQFEAHKISLFSEYMSLVKIQEFLVQFALHGRRDGRAHTMLSEFTVTGRSSSSNPNLMNLPMSPRHANDLTLKGCLVPDNDDFVLIELDISNAENWMAAMMAGDNELAAACTAEDFHSVMASKYFGAAWEQADAKLRKILRRAGKIVTFASAYGAGPAKIAKQINAALKEEIKAGIVSPVTVEDAKQLLEAKDRVFWRIADERKVREKIAYDGYAETWTGRRIYVPPPKEVKDPEGGTRLLKFNYRSWNYICQGGVADVIKIAIVLIARMLRREGFRTRVALQIHDSIILHAAVDELDLVLPRIIMLMRTVVPQEWVERTTPSVIWLTDVSHKENAEKWGWRNNRQYPVDVYERDGSPRLVTIETGEVFRQLSYAHYVGLQRKWAAALRRVELLTDGKTQVVVPHINPDGSIRFFNTTDPDILRKYTRLWKDVRRKGKVPDQLRSRVPMFLRWSTILDEAYRAMEEAEKELMEFVANNPIDLPDDQDLDAIREETHRKSQEILARRGELAAEEL